MPDGSADGIVRAAGALVWKAGTAGTEIALVHRPRYDDWSYPKGKCHRGEHVLRTAIREVGEETGFRIVLGRPLGPSVYPAAGRIKHVSYWAARYAGSSGFVPNDEVDEVRWLPVAAAREWLSYSRDAALLDEFRAGPVRTVPLILLRHAEAGRRPPGEIDQAADLARPLDARGSAGARVLAGLLASYGQCQVICSAAERCLATVRPYAEATGAPVQADLALTVISDPVRPAGQPPADLDPPDPAEPARAELASAELARAARDRTRARMSRNPGMMPGSRADAGAWLVAGLAASGVPALVCAHRENLPGLIDAAFAALGASPPLAEPLGKGEFWVLQAADGMLVSAERHDPGPGEPAG